MQSKAINVLLAPVAAYLLLLVALVTSKTAGTLEDCLSKPEMLECKHKCEDIPSHEVIRMLCRKRCVDCICIPEGYIIEGPNQQHPCSEGVEIPYNPITVQPFDY